jgi:hypothetical protein
MNRYPARRPSHHCLGFSLSLLLATIVSRHSSAQLAGTFHSAPGSTATYVYQNNGFPEVKLPADITVTFSGDTPTSMLTATIHKPIIGDTAGNFNYPIVHEFPLVVSGMSSDGRDFEGELLPNSQYYFDWQFEPAADGTLKWSGKVSWIGGRIEVSTIDDGALLIPSVPGDYNQDGSVDAADYVVWRDEVGQGPGRADGIHNGEVDVGDYHAWRAHFGHAAATPAPLSTAAPEPSALFIAAFGLAAWYAPLLRAQRVSLSVPRASSSRRSVFNLP